MLTGLLLAIALTLPSPGAPVAPPRTIVGEVVDVRCQAQSADNAGEGHADCALSCARRGALLGVAADDGIYVITGELTARGNEKLIEFVARSVEATGEVTIRDGRRLIEVTAIKVKPES